MAQESSAAIVAQTVIGDTTLEGFDRWFGATSGALAGAAAAGVVGGWSILVGDDSGRDRLDEGMIARYKNLAAIAGGSFATVRLTPGSTARERDDQLFELGSDELVLVVDSDVTVLASTVVRMIGALTSDSGLLAARRVPLDRPELETAGRCLLVPGRLWGADQVPARCAEAVVFYPGSTLDAPAVPGRESEPPVGSLLEEVMGVPGLEGAREALSRALTVPDVALLSVVMRTQLLRPEALRDVLLCLAAQTDGRFELLLVVHEGSVEHAAKILADQPQWLRSRARILSASGGTRSRPLNVGIAAATGSLVAFLDDDDLVFAHWVETFLDATMRHPRRLIRAAAGVQRVAATSWIAGLEGHRDESAVSTPYPAVFDLADHLRVNMTPLMAFAFPRRFFDLFGGADETLEVCEDWDLGLRAASVLGVSDIPALTAIYRRWNSGRDSYSVHDRTVWARDMARVRDRLNARPLLLPPGGASDLEVFSNQRGLPQQLADAYSSSSWRVTAPLRATARFARTSFIRVVSLVRGRRS